MRTLDVYAPVQGLGATDREGLFVGLGAVAPISPLTAGLIDRQNEVLARYKCGKITAEQAGPEFRKLHWGVMMNGMDEQQGFVNVAPYAYDVTPQGELVFQKETDVEAVGILGELWAIAEEYNESADPRARQFAQTVVQPALQGLNGLGSLGADSLYSLAGTLAAAEEQAGLGELGAKGRRRGKGKFKRFLGKAGRAVFLRFNPLTIVARNSFLALVRLNFLKLAEKLRLGLLSRAECEALKLDYDKLGAARKGTKKAVDIFYKLGGKRKNMIKAIIKGSRKKKFYRPLLKQPVKGLGELWYFNQSATSSGLRADNGLGEMQYYGRSAYGSGLQADNGVFGDEAISELMDTGTIGQLAEMIYPGEGFPQNPYPWIGELEDGATVGALGIAPLAPVIAAATSVMVPVMKIVKVITKVAGPAVKAAMKIRGMVKSRQEKVKAMQEAARERQAVQESQQPQAQQQVEQTAAEIQAQQQQQQTATESQTQQGLGFFKKLRAKMAANRETRALRRAEQGGSRAGKFLRSLVPGLPMSKKTQAAMKKLEAQGGQAPLITDGGIPAAAKQAASFLMAQNPYGQSPAAAAGEQAANYALQNTPPPAPESKGKPLRTALIVGGVLIAAGTITYFIFRPKKSK